MLSTQTEIKKSSALVLGCSGAFLQCIRSLGQHGIAVDVNAYDKKHYDESGGAALTSRFIREKILLPDYAENETAWVDTVRELLSEKKYNFVLPCTDDFMQRLIKYRREFEQFSVLAIPEEETYKLCSDKNRSVELAKSCGLAVPPSQKLTLDESFVETVKGFQWGYPLIFKPLASLDAGMTKQEVQRAENEDGLKSFCERYRDIWQTAVVQKFCSGSGAGIHLLAFEGKIAAAVAQERLHEPLYGGGGYYRRTIPLPQELMPHIQKLVKKINFTGPMMLEFKYDKKNNRWYFIEINARYWGSLALTRASGVDMPFLHYQMLCEGKRDFPQKYRVNKYCRNTIPDLVWAFHNLRADKRDNSLMTCSVWSVLAEWGNCLLFREKWDSFTWTDPLPFVWETLALMNRTVKKCFFWK